MYLPIVLGTAREGRKSENIARKIAQLLEAQHIDTDIIDVKESGLTATKGAVNEEFMTFWKTALTSAPGFLIVTPEYNHGYPGELKLFLDQLHDEYENKVVAIVSVANGLWGGTRVTEQLRPVLNAFNMIVLGIAIHLRNISSYFNEQGEYDNPELPPILSKVTSKIFELGTKLQSPLVIDE